MQGNQVIIFIMILFVLISAYFSAVREAYASLSRSRIKTMVDQGNKRAALVYKLSECNDKLSSTILICNYLVNFVLVSMTAVLLIQYAGPVGGALIATVIVTVVELFFIEILPKSIAREIPERCAIFAAPVLRVLVVIFTPVSYVLSLWSGLMSRIIKSEDDRRVTDEELLTMVAEAEQEGGIDRAESKLIRSAIEFNDREAVDILTPRVNVVAVERDVTAAELERIFCESGLSRLPVYEDSIDNVLGVVNLKDFYACRHDENFVVTDIAMEPVYVSETMKIGTLLQFLQKTKAHFAIVADEFGGMVGVVTMEDILEELVGEIWDEHDEVIEEFTQVSENEYKVLCSADLDKLFQFFGLDCEADSVTVSGWVMEELGRIPVEGDYFTYQNLTVKVTKTNHRHALEVLVTVLLPHSELHGEEDDE